MITPVAIASPWSGAAVLTAASLAAALAAAPLGFRAPGAARATAAARVVGRLAFYAIALALSLPWFAAAAALPGPPPPAFWLAAAPPFLVAAACVAAGARRHDVDTLTRGEAMLIAATVLAFAAGLSLPSGQGASLVATLSLFFLGAGRIVRGNALHARSLHLEGLVVVLLALASRIASSALEPTLRTGAIVAAVAAATAAVVAFERKGAG